MFQPVKYKQYSVPGTKFKPSTNSNVSFEFVEGQIPAMVCNDAPLGHPIPQGSQSMRACFANLRGYKVTEIIKHNPIDYYCQTGKLVKKEKVLSEEISILYEMLSRIMNTKFEDLNNDIIVKLKILVNYHISIIQYRCIDSVKSYSNKELCELSEICEHYLKNYDLFEDGS